MLFFKKKKRRRIVYASWRGNEEGRKKSGTRTKSTYKECAASTTPQAIAFIEMFYEKFKANFWTQIKENDKTMCISFSLKIPRNKLQVKLLR